MKERIETLPEVALAHQVVRDLDDQAELLEASTQIADELHTLLEGTPVLKRHAQLTVDTAVAMDHVLETSLALLEIQTRSLAPQGRDQRNRHAALQDARERLLADIHDVNADTNLSLSEARAAIETLRRLRSRVDAQWTATREEPTHRRQKGDDRIPKLAVSIDTLFTTLDGAYQGVHQQAQAVKAPLQKHLFEQNLLLESARDDHVNLTQVGAMVLHTAEGQGAEALEGFLAGAIRQADMGLADAAWNELMEVVEQAETAQREKNEKLNVLESTLEELRRRSR
jgi:hypothetical protein